MNHDFTTIEYIFTAIVLLGFIGFVIMIWYKEGKDIKGRKKSWQKKLDNILKYFYHP